jgi:hypothetical protein
MSSDRRGADFKWYLTKITAVVKNRWYIVMPDAALADEKGKATVRFQIRSDRRVENVTLEAYGQSGDSSRHPELRHALLRYSVLPWFEPPRIAPEPLARHGSESAANLPLRAAHGQLEVMPAGSKRKIEFEK